MNLFPRPFLIASVLLFSSAKIIFSFQSLLCEAGCRFSFPFLKKLLCKPTLVVGFEYFFQLTEVWRTWTKWTNTMDASKEEVNIHNSKNNSKISMNVRIRSIIFPLRLCFSLTKVFFDTCDYLPEQLSLLASTMPQCDCKCCHSYQIKRKS